jgi:hypothetical protein
MFPTIHQKGEESSRLDRFPPEAPPSNFSSRPKVDSPQPIRYRRARKKPNRRKPQIIPSYAPENL